MDNLVFWGGLVTVFYFLWKKNLPTEAPRPVRTPGVEGPKLTPRKEPEPSREPAPEPEKLLPAYDPASNPFRVRESEPEPQERRFRGSFDDLDTEPEIGDTEGEPEETDPGMNGETDGKAEEGEGT